MSTTLAPPPETSTETAPAVKRQSDVRHGKPKKKSVTGKFGRASLMLVRRVHLYSGIFMFPWVLLYGFTGWFFNHPRLFTGDQRTPIAVTDVGKEGWDSLPSAAATAEAIVDEMNYQSFLNGGKEIELADTRQPRFTGFLTYSVDADELIHEISLNPVTGRGEVRTSYVEPEEEHESERSAATLDRIERVDIRDNPLDIAQKRLPAALEESQLAIGEITAGRRAPNVVFSVQTEGRPYLVTYNLGSSGITAVPEHERPAMGTKSFLQRLHLARMYSPDFDIRWVWALLVDAMFVSMVFWGISGLMMWWQVKRTRLLGGGVLLASVLFAAVMGVGMHDDLSSGVGRGHGGGHGGRGGPARRGGGGRNRVGHVEPGGAPAELIAEAAH